MKIGVGDVDEPAGLRDIGGRGEKTERREANHFIRAGVKFPHRAIGSPVRHRNVEELPVRRNGDAVRAVDVRGHQPDVDFVVELQAGRIAGMEAHALNFVRRFAHDVSEIVLRSVLRSIDGRAEQSKRTENE